jgi:hypothetical protein
MNGLQEMIEAGEMPLGERVQCIQSSGGGANIHDITFGLSVQEGDVNKLPRGMQAKRRALDKKTAEKTELASSLIEDAREFSRLEFLKANRPTLTQRKSTLESFQTICKADVAEFGTSLDTTDISTSSGWAAALERAHSTCVAEKLLTILPRKIEQVCAEIEATDAEITTLSAKFE